MKKIESETNINIYEDSDKGGNFGGEMAPGDEGEEAYLEFLGDVFGSVKWVKQTEKWGKNDEHGIDGVACLENDDGKEFLLALEPSGARGKRRGEKRDQQKREPMVQVLEERDKDGNITIEATKGKIPRLRIGYNLDYILALVHEAKEKGLKMSQNMQQNRKKELIRMKRNILDSFEMQIQQQNDYEFRQAIQPIREIFDSEREELE